MAILLQGLVLMVSGMGIAFAFLSLLVLVTSCSSKFIARFNNAIFPEPVQKKAAPVAASDDTAIAVAIAVAKARA